MTLYQHFSNDDFL